MTEEAIARLLEAVRDEDKHCAGRYGPHVDGVLVSDLRLVLREARRSMESRAREVCMKRGHEFADADESGSQFCVHCGAEYTDK